MSVSGAGRVPDLRTVSSPSCAASDDGPSPIISPARSKTLDSDGLRFSAVDRNELSDDDEDMDEPMIGRDVVGTSLPDEALPRLLRIHECDGATGESADMARLGFDAARDRLRFSARTGCAARLPPVGEVVGCKSSGGASRCATAASRRRSPIATWPWVRATSSAVQPCFSRMSARAPACSSRKTMLRCPLAAAKCNGVAPVVPTASTLPPRS